MKDVVREANEDLFVVVQIENRDAVDRIDDILRAATTDEIRLIWGMGGQILRRPRPDVPTQRF